jgi:hypothetical protein
MLSKVEIGAGPEVIDESVNPNAVVSPTIVG